MGDEATAMEPDRMQTPRKKQKSSRIVLSCHESFQRALMELGFIFDAFVQKRYQNLSWSVCIGIRNVPRFFDLFGRPVRDRAIGLQGVTNRHMQNGSEPQKRST